MSSSPLERFLHWEKQCPQKIYLRQPIDGKWITWTWEQAGEEARRLAAGLQSLGLKQGDHVALLSKNCAQWIISDIAIMMAGFISIPIYPTLSAHAIEPILIHSDAKAIILGKLDDYSTQVNGIPAGMYRIGMNTYGIQEEFSYEKLVETNDPIKEAYDWKTKDVFTIIYTSGTTGVSKGVMHAVEAFDVVVSMAQNHLGIPSNPVLFSYLPLSHIAERMAIEMISFYTCGDISFAESIELFPKNLAATQPDLFFAVPRIWGKIREGILKKMPQKKLDRLLSIPIIRGVVIKGIKKKLGLSRATHIYSAAAPLSPDIQKWYSKIGILIRQAYGMTEDCVYSHFDTMKEYRFGCVGKPLPGLLVKIADNGEIRLKSVSNMKGYYKEPGLTAESFDEDQYLKTGDIGEYDADGFLKITGRVKDMFKTDKGKYIAPSPIEMRILINSKIEQACVVGTGVPQPIVLVTLSDAGKSVSRSELENELLQLMQNINTDLEVYEKLEKVVIMKDNWTIANNLLTPSLKVKRNEVEKIHLPKYPYWYEQKGKIVWE